MSEIVRIVIYADQETKDKLNKLANEHEPRTSASGFGAMLLKRGMAAYEKEQASKNGDQPNE